MPSIFDLILQTPEDILNFAIENEQNSADLYMSLHKEVNDSKAKDMFIELYEEEIRHKKILYKMKEHKALDVPEIEALKLQKNDYLPTIEYHKTMKMNEVLQYAIQAENTELNLYLTLAEEISNVEIKESLLLLAQEEGKHKLKLEQEYKKRFRK